MSHRLVLCIRQTIKAIVPGGKHKDGNSYSHLVLDPSRDNGAYKHIQRDMDRTNGIYARNDYNPNNIHSTFSLPMGKIQA